MKILISYFLIFNFFYLTSSSSIPPRTQILASYFLRSPIRIVRNQIFNRFFDKREARVIEEELVNAADYVSAEVAESWSYLWNAQNIIEFVANAYDVLCVHVVPATFLIGILYQIVGEYFPV